MDLLDKMETDVGTMLNKIAPIATNELKHIQSLMREAEARWASKIIVDNSLTRALVSFQANKSKAVYRWYKYKEAFSADLVNYFLNKYRISKGIMLDPFAGSGTALFVAAGMGIKAEGIELLPLGRTIIQTRQVIENGLDEGIMRRLEFWRDNQPWEKASEIRPIIELRITRGAYPDTTFKAIGQFLKTLEDEDEKVKSILLYALLSILENVSYTRKDGQYLRWDYRAGRHHGEKIFDKGEILDFDSAMAGKLGEMISDLRSADFPDDLFSANCPKEVVHLYGGSCLEILPKLKANSYNLIFTSPPYCNRYDYTRTYALELALLGVNEAGLLRLRQDMLSCTVENREKDLLALNPKWNKAVEAADQQALLQDILKYLALQKDLDLLNNNGIPRMIKGYFYEMACVIYEAARILKKNAPFIMVNDNVRYAGASISVDIILSEIAESLGFRAEKILVLPNGKGNSSQQMGNHGRETLRKCVYVWRKE